MPDHPRPGRALPETAQPCATPFESIALLLQGGGALGAYQAGVYARLHEAGIEPTWVAGISIGAINCAIIAGNRPQDRVGALRSFWEQVSATSDLGLGALCATVPWPDAARAWVNQLHAGAVMAGGVPGFFCATPAGGLAGQCAQLLRHGAAARHAAAPG